MTDQIVGDAEAHAREYQRLWETAVRTLTAAARLTHPEHGEIDFADFLASALAAVAGNVGSTDRVTAGRSGSWEADLVQQLLAGTVGEDEHHLVAYRSEPVVVPLNVAQLASETREDAPETERERMLPCLYQAIDALPDPYAETGSATAEQLDRFDAAEDALRHRYTEAFTLYARAFEAAVHAAAADLLPGLGVPVSVEVDADPDSLWWREGSTANPDPWNEQDLTGRLWAAALERAGLPTLTTPAQRALTS